MDRKEITQEIKKEQIEAPSKYQPTQNQQPAQPAQMPQMTEMQYMPEMPCMHQMEYMPQAQHMMPQMQSTPNYMCCPFLMGMNCPMLSWQYGNIPPMYTMQEPLMQPQMMGQMGQCPYYMQR